MNSESATPLLAGSTASIAAPTITTPIDTSDSPYLWDKLNAIAVQGAVTLLFVIIIGVMSAKGSIDEIGKNWDKYRCMPTVMPFASLYGHDTGENFSWCMNNLFGSYTGEVTSPFTTVLYGFSEVLQTLLQSMDSLRTSASTMGGGINVIFQEFTDRIYNFFFQLRLSAIRIKTMISRMYAVMFSAIYMGLSGITAVSNFGDTTLFGFLDTFCFAPETMLHVRRDQQDLDLAIQDIRIGDVLLPTGSTVTAKFHFSAKGQTMVKLPTDNQPIHVSTNHYLVHKNKWIMAKDHPDAVPSGLYERHSLICLNTSDHQIPIQGYVFRDYDETSTADKETLQLIHDRINTPVRPDPTANKSFENSPSLHPDTLVQLANGSFRPAKHLVTGDQLATGSRVTGIIHKQIHEFCRVTINGTTVCMGPATLVWIKEEDQWLRACAIAPIEQCHTVFLGFIVTPNSQIELTGGIRVRDYMELCSPDAEALYTAELQQQTYNQS